MCCAMRAGGYRLDALVHVCAGVGWWVRACVRAWGGGCIGNICGGDRERAGGLLGLICRVDGCMRCTGTNGLWMDEDIQYLLVTCILWLPRYVCYVEDGSLGLCTGEFAGAWKMMGLNGLLLCAGCSGDGLWVAVIMLVPVFFRAR